MGESTTVQTVRAMGFPTAVIQDVLRDAIDDDSKTAFLTFPLAAPIEATAAGLLDAVVQRMAESTPSPTAPSTASAGTPPPVAPLFEWGTRHVSLTGAGGPPDNQGHRPTPDDDTLQEDLKKMQEEQMCKICYDEPADMAYVPCGHMCCCRNCTEAILCCPICRTRIKEAIKSYKE